MKIINKIILVVMFIALGTSLMFSQKSTTQAIDKPEEGKSLIYIANLATKKVAVFKNTDLVSSIKVGNYVKYSVEPGTHIFWAAKKPSNFVEANVEANKVYVLTFEPDATASVGGTFGLVGALAGSALAGAVAKPLNPEEFSDRKAFYRIIKNMKSVELDTTPINKSESDTKEMTDKAMVKYSELKEKQGKDILLLSPNWKFENADKPVKQK
ncbi:hypothetical protein [Bergeyella zoohelcum]|uniref:DUF2846 domain-containing protein n=2 Tax=Bergeyella zoohelcum TaxID=1015 RepID=K1M158_9FLAO|nr:hypothetical protein [Bergeyella zoohelcum]EKB58037.1 hypothetical protein HMPREF9699_00695 [Bergeyella zoohelcum ATCC 43767]EKB61208.1 hypothetical protein HMPREF9700_00703 [Bergeyella zoohelcum CCUG 30536]MDY6026306.1 hypothetical protein [Bergeyella zoohelcum]SSZ46701.1 Uncharacterised protein [Bergeyella zoohelcum]SUV49119.1 Uncharacterised protein [Bergeyella zoohelcum]